MPPISAVLITHNAQDTIEPTLRALAWCAEIVIVDSGSTDQTVEICRRNGCRVIHHDFEGFGRQKHFAVGCAASDWVFVVDADEVVSDPLRDEIRSVLADDTCHYVGFRVPISLVFLGRLLRFGGEYNKLHLRLFNRRAGNFNAAEVHEDVVLQGPVGVLRGHVWHYSYRDVQHYFDKFNRYTSLAANSAWQRGKRASRALIVLRWPFSFLHLYFIKGLILDGYPGFVWAMFSSMYKVVKSIKLDELERHSRDKLS
jgi:glycosyltransferase involved in cell wall biosynthesis